MITIFCIQKPATRKFSAASNKTYLTFVLWPEGYCLDTPCVSFKLPQLSAWHDANIPQHGCMVTWHTYQLQFLLHPCQIKYCIVMSLCACQKMAWLFTFLDLSTQVHECVILTCIRSMVYSDTSILMFLQRTLNLNNKLSRIFSVKNVSTKIL